MNGKENQEVIKFRSNRSSGRSHKALGRLERAIMEVIWEKGASTVSAMHKALRQEKNRDLAYTTVMTTMSRMAQKRLLHQDRSSTTYVYSPVLDRASFEGYRIKGIITELLDDYGDKALDYIVAAVNERGEDSAQRLRSAVIGERNEGQAS